MSDLERNVKGAVRIEDNSVERVALDLTKWIAKFDTELQDQILELFARSLITARDPHKGLEATKKSAKIRGSI